MGKSLNEAAGPQSSTPGPPGVTPGVRFRGLTSDDGQLGGDGVLALAVLRHALVDVLVPGGPQGLDPQHGPRPVVVLDGLEHTGSQSHTRGGPRWAVGAGAEQTVTPLIDCDRR